MCVESYYLVRLGLPSFCKQIYQQNLPFVGVLDEADRYIAVVYTSFNSKIVYQVVAGD